MILPGSLTYRTYGYLMVAYAVEKQWGAAIELALVCREHRITKREGKGRGGGGSSLAKQFSTFDARPAVYTCYIFANVLFTHVFAQATATELKHQRF